MSQQHAFALAVSWIFILFTILAYCAIRYTDRHFWKGIGFGLILAVTAVITGIALATIIVTIYSL